MSIAHYREVGRPPPLSAFGNDPCNLKTACEQHASFGESQKAKLNSQWGLALKEINDGMYCSICNRSKSQIERTGVSFSQHLRDVKGRAIPGGQKAKDAVNQEFSAKVKQVEAEIADWRRQAASYWKQCYNGRVAAQIAAKQQKPAIVQGQWTGNGNGADGDTGGSGALTTSPDSAFQDRDNKAAYTDAGKSLPEMMWDHHQVQVEADKYADALTDISKSRDESAQYAEDARLYNALDGVGGGLQIAANAGKVAIVGLETLNPALSKGLDQVMTGSEGIGEAWAGNYVKAGVKGVETAVKFLPKDLKDGATISIEGHKGLYYLSQGMWTDAGVSATKIAGTLYERFSYVGKLAGPTIKIVEGRQRIVGAYQSAGRIDTREAWSKKQADMAEGKVMPQFITFDERLNQIKVAITAKQQGAGTSGNKLANHAKEGDRPVDRPKYIPIGKQLASPAPQDEDVGEPELVGNADYTLQLRRDANGVLYKVVIPDRTEPSGATTP
jgi:hypothetical protein